MSKLSIVSKRDGFRRCGYEFNSKPTSIEISKLTEEQIKTLKSDPMLIVVEGNQIVSSADSGTSPELLAALTQAQQDLAKANDLLTTEKELTSKLSKGNEELKSQLAKAEKEIKDLQANKTKSDATVAEPETKLKASTAEVATLKKASKA